MNARADFADARAVVQRLEAMGVALSDLTADSRAVKMGSVFVACPGTVRDGRAFIGDAVARGAAAVLWESEGFAWDDRWQVPNLGVARLRSHISQIAGEVYGHPSRSLWMAGVTGTNGKTSVAQWIAAALDGLGRRAAVLGTLGNGLVGERAEARNTTPDPILLQRLLAEYLRRGAHAAAMEVSSHGLDQERVAGIAYDVAVFTNLTRDHLDYHGTMEAYAEAKYRLFSATGLTHAVVNVDDAWGARFARRLAGSGLDVITFGSAAANDPNPRLRASHARLSEAGVSFRIEGEWGEGEVRSPVLGMFNVSNLLAVAGGLLAAGIPFDGMLGALRALQPVPGRLERLGGGHQPLVVIDYAHTPDALEKALQALRAVLDAGPRDARRGRLLCVFGCGGDRDAGKRPLMGEAAARLADHVIVTSDNPRNEEPRAIIAQVLAGIPARRAEAIEDRQVAIFTAVHQAAPGDVVLLAGKGHETYQEIAGTRHPFNDREVAAAALAEREGAQR
ncbi:MAG TPA: UDP-N-acetylmuramoyl-L-alanyl-D-glutamate--2,6-diaminopimelate ligase [Usitatibacter sp.]|jgi:UDP-N-acetylmuramoyl-L-alanyl-D-glutamate--2,6-diaminopimelate ligase|nr:UDP-N-acetylmuramoyl-L-alanyl-D-glutamate--2,6-diaminopimelate ligase [Usitatibacter sp.]